MVWVRQRLCLGLPGSITIGHCEMPCYRSTAVALCYAAVVVALNSGNTVVVAGGAAQSCNTAVLAEAETRLWPRLRLRLSRIWLGWAAVLRCRLRFRPGRGNA
eukprot:2247468-Pyramimonas_sp.AAC.1